MKFRDFIQMTGIWIFPLGAAAFVFSVMLLFSGSLPGAMRQWMLPSLAVYLIGVGNVIFWKELVHARTLDRRMRQLIDDGVMSAPPQGRAARNFVLRKHSEGPNLSAFWIWIFGLLQAGLLGGWIIYNVCKGAL